MCFDLDSQPPVPPAHASDARGEELTLTSADGAPFAVYYAQADSVRYNGAGVVILPDVRGLFQFYEDLALRFAEAGVETIAIDYFGRTAGVSARDDSFDFMAHVQQTKAAQIRDDVAAAVAKLRSGPNAPKAIFAVGFCFGGSNAFHQASNKLGLAGVIGYYGNPIRRRSPDSPAPIERIAEVTCPILGLFGGADQGISAEDVKRYDEALAQAGVEHAFTIYPGAPHSFFDRKQEEFAKESEDSWNRALAFISAHTPQV